MFVVFDYKSITFLVIAVIIIIGAIAYFMRDCNCKTGPQGPQGPAGQTIDLSDYKGNVNISGDIYASGKIKSGDCQLNCNVPTPTPTKSSSSSSTWIWVSVSLFIILIGAGYAYYKGRSNGIGMGKRLFGPFEKMPID